MADVYGFPNFELNEYSFHGGDGYIITGASGAIRNDGVQQNVWGETLSLPRGISSVVRNSTGNYTFTLSDAWHDVFPVVVPVVPSGALMVATIVNQNPRSQNDTNGLVAQTFTIQFTNASGAVDPPNGGGFNIFFKSLNTGRLA